MRYILNKDYNLCGWRNMPYALKSFSRMKVMPLTLKQLKLLFACSGKKELAVDAFDDESRVFFDMLLREEIIREALEGERRTLAYTEYQGIFKQDVQWSVTGRCNYNCRHCFQSAPDEVLGHPSLGQCLDIVHQLKECGVMRVALTGGEPLIRGDFWDIVDEIYRCGMSVSTIYSNGKLVTEEFMDQIEKRGIHPHFQISFDGVGSHDWMRNVPGAEKIALDAIRLISNQGCSVGSAMCLCRENVSSIRQTVRTLAEAGCSGLKLQRCMPMGEWAGQKEHFLTYEETLQAYLDYLPLYKEDGMPMNIQAEGFYSCSEKTGLVNLSDRKGDEESLGNMPPCGIIKTSFYIGPNGAVTPCMSMCGSKIEAQFPNLSDMKLKDILTDSNYTKLTGYSVKDVMDHNEKCADCKYRCQCCAGCRAFAVGAEGCDYLAVDPITCKILTEGWYEKLEKVREEVFGVS